MAVRVGSFCFVSCTLGSSFLSNTYRAFLGVCTSPLTNYIPSLTPDFPANSIDQAEGGRPRPLIQAAHKENPLYYHAATTPPWRGGLLQTSISIFISTKMGSKPLIVSPRGLFHSICMVLFDMGAAEIPLCANIFWLIGWRGGRNVYGGDGEVAAIYCGFTVLFFGCSEGRLILPCVHNEAIPPAPVSICFGRLDFGTCLTVLESQILFTISNTYKASWYKHVGGSMAESVRGACLSRGRDKGALYVGEERGIQGDVRRWR